MSAIAKKIDLVLRGELARTLKSEGFRKHARTFVRERCGVQQIVNAQASQWNEGLTGNFTLNLGVYHPRVASRRGLVASGAYPREYESTARQRVGHLMPGVSDYWWEITSSTDLETLAKDVDETYLQFGAPWLESMLELSSVFRFLETQSDPLMTAAVALELGNTELAQRILAFAYATARPEFAPTLRRFAERHGILLSSEPAA